MTSPSHEEQASSVTPPKLSSKEIDELLALRLIAKLATTDRSGTIHLVPMWFLRDSDRLLIPTSRLTHKYRNVKRTPSASVMVDISRSGLDLRGVLIRGSVELIEGDDAKRLNHSIHQRYVTVTGLDQPEVSDYLNGDDVTIAVSIDHIVSWNNAGSPAGEALLQSGHSLPLDL
jgi:nitroimidazol reductase NimA-like FMN-containing flavoprotein (pyridoxamine 5'-phosphate oxidase superfamily)